MSQHSALLSLTATYTDSEEEAETEAESSHSTVLIIAKTSAANSPQADSASELFIQVKESHKAPLRAPESQQNLQQSSLGLVSYQDDLIDDDAIDDVYTSDSNQGQEEPTEEEDRTKVSVIENDKLKVENEVVKNGEKEVETISLEEENTVPKKASLIPAEVPGKCPPELQEKFAKMYEKKMKRGLDMNQAIQRNKNFRNPSIYEKLIKYCDIDELGSNYPRNVFDPHEWHESSYYDELAKAQKELMEKRERDRKDRTKVDFVSGTVKKPNSQETEPKRKSKWDQRGVMPPLLLSASFSQPPPPVVIPPFTNSASGTKSTVISAFGNINKKTK